MSTKVDLNSRGLSLDQQASLTVKKKPVVCSQCGDLRTQETRCENCGCEKPYSEERVHDESF